MESETPLEKPRATRRGRRPSQSVTVGTVAKAAGVSRAAVSFAYNDPDQISVETRERILEIAESLGYTPDPVARLLSMRQSYALGLLTVESIATAFADPFMSLFIRGMGQVCDQHGLALTLLSHASHSMTEAVQSAIVDGLILQGVTPDPQCLSAIRRRNLPLIVVDGAPSDAYTSIGTNDYEGARDAARHLAQLGHRHIGILAFAQHPLLFENSQSYVRSQRLSGYEAGFAGLDPRVRMTIISASSDSPSGYQATQELLNMKAERPSAILAMSDALALGAMQACEEYGLRIPYDMSVVGFDNISESAAASLSTIGQPIMEKAILAVELLVAAKAADIPPEPGHHVLPTTFIDRGSTRKPIQSFQLTER